MFPTVSCTIWESNDYKKVDLTVLDISSSIIRKIDMTPESTDYFKAGLAFCVILCLIPSVHRLNDTTKLSNVTLSFDMLILPSTGVICDRIGDALNIALGATVPYVCSFNLEFRRVKWRQLYGNFAFCVSIGSDCWCYVWYCRGSHSAASSSSCCPSLRERSSRDTYTQSIFRI